MRWADLIGKPFVYGGRGPDVYDCYGLLIECHRRNGLVLPDYTSPDNGPQISALFANQLVLWGKAEQGQGMAVLIRVPGNMHCGYMIDDHRMIHTWEKSGGVLVEEIAEWQRRILGFYVYVG